MYAFARGGCTDATRESSQKVDSGRKIPCHTRESNLSQQLASLTLYQMSYIPNLSMYLTVWNTVSGDIFTVCFFLELFCLFVFFPSYFDFLCMCSFRLVLFHAKGLLLQKRNGTEKNRLY